MARLAAVGAALSSRLLPLFLSSLLVSQLDTQLKLLIFSVAMQFDATLDVLSSFIVLWRYMNAAAVHSAHREYM